MSRIDFPIVRASLASLLVAATVHGDVFTHRVEIDANDSPEEIISKAASVVPSRAQLLHHQDEFIGFVHFGPNTFSGVEWGNGKEDPKIFNPGDTFDTDQWCRILKAAGMTKVVITVKHHDGFCTWQTRYNDTFSVRAIPWRDGKGDVLRSLSQSCHKHGLKLGVYLSPADLYQMESATGLYGNLSKYRTSVIPTDVESFKTDPMKVRPDKPEGAPNFTVDVDDYNRYFMNQLYELLTEYGPIHEVWFDGAHPKRKGGQKYVKEEWFKMIRQLAPEAVIFGGPDVRWCGNEGGFTRESEWNVLPVQDELASGGDRRGPDLGSDEKLLDSSYKIYSKTYYSKYLYYLICEVDTSIRSGWFWRKDQAVRTPDDVFDIYERAVGGNATFLLNVPPNKQGLISARDEACLLEVGKRLRATYGKNLIQVKDIKGPVGQKVADGNLATYWQPKGDTGSLEVLLQQPRTINRFELQEAISQVGQRVKKHAVDAWVDSAWQEIAAATTIGYKRILRFPAVTTDRFRIRILDSRESPAIAEVGGFFYQQPPPSVAVDRGNDGVVRLSLVAPSHRFPWKGHAGRKEIPVESDSIEIRYTLDGSEPTLESTRYTKRLELADGGHLRARSVDRQSGQIHWGPIAESRLGISRSGWKIHDVSNQHNASYGADRAIDGDPATYWHTSWAKGYPTHPHQLTIDLGREVDVAGITYLPRQDKPVPDGMVESGRIELSRDGKEWLSAGEFHFGNLVNDPTQRTYLFEKTETARYIRFISKTGVQGKPYAGAAEIGVLKGD